MKEKTDLGILSLDWASRTMGANLELGNVAAEAVRRFKKKFPVKDIRIFLWDKSRRCLSFLPTALNRRASGKISATAEMLKALEGQEAVISRSRVFIPLKRENDPVGIMELSDKAIFLKRKDEILEFSRLITVLLSNTRIFKEAEVRTQDMFRFNVLSRALNPTVHEEQIVKILLEGLAGIIRFDIAGMLLLSKQNKRVFIKSASPLDSVTMRTVRNNLIDLAESLTRSHLDREKIIDLLSVARGKSTSRKINSRLDAPLITKGKFLGVLTLYSFEKEQFSARDAQNISSLVAHGAVAFENAMLYQDLRRTYFSIINALTSAIEAKDEYTQGHSVLVSKYSAAIALEMGLSASIIESIQIAGLLHDLGKIGVPEEILVKKGKLTDSEYGIVKTHPDIAMKILGPVEFPHFVTEEERIPEAVPELTLNLFEGADLSSEVKLMIYHHHEKYGGGGYPDGIKGEEIPLGARILSVSDTFEALTADRPYRKAFSLDEAIKILRQISGSQLDSKIVEVFVKVLQEKGLDTLKSMEGI